MKPEGRSGIHLAAATVICGIVCAAAWTGCGDARSRMSGQPTDFEFVVISDVESACDPDLDSPEYFPGVCAAIRRAGKGDFMVAAGDVSPPSVLDGMIRKALGDDYPWYAVVGNHDVKEKHISWLRSHNESMPGISRWGPRNAERTTYSFDHKGIHFVVLNEYYSGISDSEHWSDVCPSLYDWLEEDLAANKGERVIVFGHEPLAAIPDADNSVVNHEETNLYRHGKNAHRFWALLRKHGVVAYVCGHTDTFSWAKLNGVWQISSGHARGMEEQDTASTFLKFQVGADTCRVQVYRNDASGGPYDLKRSLTLD